jgi:hypothetical protein
MKSPRIRLQLRKGMHGISLSQLADVARETTKFLISLSVDIGDADSGWVADNFENGSLMFDVRKEHESLIDDRIWISASWRRT